MATSIISLEFDYSDEEFCLVSDKHCNVLTCFVSTRDLFMTYPGHISMLMSRKFVQLTS